MPTHSTTSASPAGAVGARRRGCRQSWLHLLALGRFVICLRDRPAARELIALAPSDRPVVPPVHGATTNGGRCNSGRRRRARSAPGRALPPRAARPLLPDARLRARRRGRAAGGLLRAWRGLARFEGRSSLRSWLYTIATNTCLNDDRAAAAARAADRPRPADRTWTTGWACRWPRWSGSSPTRTSGSASRTASPRRMPATSGARASSSPSSPRVQLLPATQRAVLILREVLGFSAREVAEALDTTVASVNSALQRARKTLDERLPEHSQQATLRSLGDRGSRGRRGLHGRHAARRRRPRRGDAGEDAAWSMPPLPAWFAGPEGSAASSSTARCRASGAGATSRRGQRPGRDRRLRLDGGGVARTCRSRSTS